MFADDANLEYKIKAGYLYNFTKFISWPEIHTDTFNLCLLGNDPFGDIIDPIQKKQAFERPIKVIRLNNSTSLSNANKSTICNILYIDNENSLKQVLEQLKANPNKSATLIVGENEMFTSAGGMISFINRDGKIKLRINLSAVKKSELKISAKLYEIAELIKAEEHD